MWGFGGQAGYYTDPETGLVLCTNRFYDPQQGRFLTRDPSGYNGSVNLYSYTQNNPVNGVDPSGLQTRCEKLLDIINNTRGKLDSMITKYDPADDFAGGTPYTINGVTRYAQRFVHYHKIIEYQARLLGAIAEYNSRCGGRGGPFVPSPDPELLQHPVFPSPSWQKWQQKFLPATGNGNNDMPVRDDGFWLPMILPLGRAAEGAGLVMDGVEGVLSSLGKSVIAPVFSHMH